ncbi:hypothetical protein WN943_026210 [Citrus x changshan-huyou]
MNSVSQPLEFLLVFSQRTCLFDPRQCFIKVFTIRWSEARPQLVNKCFPHNRSTFFLVSLAHPLPPLICLALQVICR